jgi:FkbM family methyltransferase
MFPRLVARFTAAVPSSVKYKLKRLKPVHARLMRLGQHVINIESLAGDFKWEIDELTSQGFVLGTYESHMQKAFVRFVKPGFTVYDVGAHAGYHSMVSGKLVGSSGTVIAFEPNPSNFKSIQRQLKANPEVRVSLRAVALSDECGKATFDTSPGSSQGRLSTTGDLNVDVRTIDWMVESQDIPRPDLIKLDVEGHEEAVLRGGMAVLTKYHPLVLCDTNDETTYPCVARLLEPIGYKLYPGPPITAIPTTLAEDN